MLQLVITFSLTICIAVQSDDDRRGPYLEAFHFFVGISNPVVKVFSTRGEARKAWICVTFAAAFFAVLSQCLFSQQQILEGLLLLLYLTAKIWINLYVPIVASADEHKGASSPAGHENQGTQTAAPPAHDSLPRAVSQIASAASQAALPRSDSSRASGRSGSESGEAPRHNGSPNSLADSNPDHDDTASIDSGTGGNGGRATGAGSTGSLRHRHQRARRTDASAADDRSAGPALQSPEQQGRST